MSQPESDFYVGHATISDSTIDGSTLDLEKMDSILYESIETIRLSRESGDYFYFERETREIKASWLGGAISLQVKGLIEEETHVEYFGFFSN